MSNKKANTGLNQTLFTNKLGSGYTPEEREKLLALYEQAPPQTKGYELVQGTVISINDRAVVIDVGLKSDGLVPLSEFRDSGDLKVGDQVEVYLEQQEDKKGQPVLSRKKAKLVKGWELIQEALDNEKIIEGIVKRRTKGGLIVDVFGIEAFLPGSQIDVRPVLDFDAFIGKKIDVAVLKVKHASENVVVSHKVLIEKDLESQKSSIIGNLERGQILEGTVKNITNFGVFVDLGGVDGLLHITDISWSKVSHPEALFERGQQVKVVVTDFDEEKKRISLGMKQLTPHPWEALAETIQPGAKVKGRVVNLTDYGAFIEIQKGVEGLIHISEMSWSQYLHHPKDYVKVGDEVEAVVLSLNREERKMSLGIKQLTPMPWTEENMRAKYPTGSKHQGTIRNLTNFGAFIELEPGVEGLLHISDMSWTQKVNHPSELLKTGDQIETMILGVDIENKKITLGMKQLEENPWDTFEGIFVVDSIHKGTVIKKTPKGAIVELPYGLEGYAMKRGLIKEDKQEAEVGDVLDFKITEFLKDDKKILVSHTDIFSSEPASKPSTGSAPKKATKRVPGTAAPKNLVTAQKTTLGDLKALSDLKEQIEEASRAKSTSKDKIEEAPEGLKT